MSSTFARDKELFSTKLRKWICERSIVIQWFYKHDWKNIEQPTGKRFFQKDIRTRLIRQTRQSVTRNKTDPKQTQRKWTKMWYYVKIKYKTCEWALQGCEWASSSEINNRMLNKLWSLDWKRDKAYDWWFVAILLKSDEGWIRIAKDECLLQRR